MVLIPGTRTWLASLVLQVPLTTLAREATSTLFFSRVHDVELIGRFGSYFYIGGAAWPTPPKSPAQWVSNTFTDRTGISRNVETAIVRRFPYFLWLDDLIPPRTVAFLR